MSDQIVLPEELRHQTLGGVLVDYHVEAGTVIDSRKWSETSISGGGGQVTSNTLAGTTGYIRPITSSTTQVEEIFVKLESGTERRMQVFDAYQFGVRAGSRLLILFGGTSGQDAITHIMTYNRDTRQVAMGASSSGFLTQRGLKAYGVFRKLTFLFVLFIILGAVLFYVASTLPSQKYINDEFSSGTGAFAAPDPGEVRPTREFFSGIFGNGTFVAELLTFIFAAMPLAMQITLAAFIFLVAYEWRSRRRFSSARRAFEAHRTRLQAWVTNIRTTN